MSNNNNQNYNNRIIELYQSDKVERSGLIKHGFYNIDTKNITISLNHAINSHIKFTVDKDKWQNNHKLLKNELEQYGIHDDEQQLLFKKFLNDNESILLTNYNVSSNSNQNLEPEEKKNTIKKVIVYKYSELGKGPLHEAVLINRLPYFVKYNHVKNTYELVENIPENDRILRPPNEDEYPYTPYSFNSNEELVFFMQKAKEVNLDQLFKFSKNIFFKYVDQDNHVVILLVSDAIWTYFQDLFPTTHYCEGVGTNDVGKSSIGYTFEYTGYRVIKGTAISGANYNRILGNVEPAQCCIIEDESDDISGDSEKTKILKSGYEYNSKVPKINMNTRDQLPNWFLPYCHKIILAEKSLKEYKVPGLVDRTFSFPCRPGKVRYAIKEVVSQNINKSPILQKLYDELLSFRKLMLCYRLIHYKDLLSNIETSLKNRDNELCKPLLQLFYGTEVIKEIISTLEIFVKQRRTRKGNSLEAALYPIIKKHVFAAEGFNSETQTFEDLKQKIENKKSVKIAFSYIWNSLIKDNAIEGRYDEKKSKYEYETEDHGSLYLNSLPTFISDKFTAKVKKESYGRALIFDIEKLERFENLYGDIHLNEDKIKIEVTLKTEKNHKYDDYDDFDDFLGVDVDLSEKNSSDKTNDNERETK